MNLLTLIPIGQVACWLFACWLLQMVIARRRLVITHVVYLMLVIAFGPFGVYIAMVIFIALIVPMAVVTYGCFHLWLLLSMALVIYGCCHLWLLPPMAITIPVLSNGSVLDLSTTVGIIRTPSTSHKVTAPRSGALETTPPRRRHLLLSCSRGASGITLD